MDQPNLVARIKSDLIVAMKAKEQLSVTTLRMLQSELLLLTKEKNAVAGQVADDSVVVHIIQKMTKQRQESVRQFTAAGRDELADKEKAEIAILQVYLPAQLDDTAISACIDEAFAACEPSSMKDMGQVMGMLQKKLAGQADMAAVSAQVRARLMVV